MRAPAGPLAVQPTRLDERGAGVALVEGMEVHVAGVLPGELYPPTAADGRRRRRSPAAAP